MYSTNNGTSLDILRVTDEANGVALVKFNKYFKEKVKEQFCWRSIVVDSSWSMEAPCLIVMLPAPKSPTAWNLIPSFVQSIVTNYCFNELN